MLMLTVGHLVVLAWPDRDRVVIVSPMTGACHTLTVAEFRRAARLAKLEEDRWARA